MNEGLGVMNGAFFWTNEKFFLSLPHAYCTYDGKIVTLRWNGSGDKRK